VKSTNEMGEESEYRSMIDVYERDGVTCVEGKIIRDGRKAGTVYSFLVDGMLVDTGPRCLESDLIPFYENQSIELVALTHSHEDHTGTASWLQENRNVSIYVHEKGVTICAETCPYPKYRQISWGIRKEFKALPLGDTIQSRNQEWQVIYTPGHADDHVSLLHEETGRLFSGDLFVTPKTKVIMDSESIPLTMNSIRTLLSYDFGSMFCCHAGYIKNGKEMMKQKLDYLENLCGEVKHLHKEGLSIAEINEKLFPKKYPIIAFSGGEWDSLHIVSSIVSDEKLM
jgi:endoribonuclease LACTB2